MKGWNVDSYRQFISLSNFNSWSLPLRSCSVWICHCIPLSWENWIAGWYLCWNAFWGSRCYKYDDDLRNRNGPCLTKKSVFSPILLVSSPIAETFVWVALIHSVRKMSWTWERKLNIEWDGSFLFWNNAMWIRRLGLWLGWRAVVMAKVAYVLRIRDRWILPK
jgi:hypothetical protein